MGTDSRPGVRPPTTLQNPLMQNVIKALLYHYRRDLVPWALKLSYIITGDCPQTLSVSHITIGEV